MKRIAIVLTFITTLFITATTMAQSVRLDATATHQRITGFGGFVCSPQFTYGHMSSTDIKKVWGTGSTVGCNIMRLYIPIGKNAWSQSLQTAKTAKQMGLIVFASPWGQPAEWKTNGTSNAKNSDGTTGKLKRANWPDYAQYLEDYVQYLRKNGVELDAISIQNEPDWPAEYAGCLWSGQEIAEFVKTYGPTISCKVMAPETLGVSDSYANELNKTDVLPGFDIYGGHQYGGLQSAYKKLAAKGKELWMTEYLINWNENTGTTRNFSYDKDVFDFFRAINTCMKGDFNAWVHYAAKRYYAMLGDGQCGTSNGTVTKRGYVMAHFARFVTGMTRIDATFSNTSLDGTAYLSQTGDTVVAVIANDGDKAVALTVDLPFYTTTGHVYTTTRTTSLSGKAVTLDEETCRPKADIAPQSVVTLLFVRSRDRQHSDMKATFTRFDRIDDMKPTNTTFGSTYLLSGKVKTFDHSHPLISSRTTTANGYLALSDRFTHLVMEIKKVSSTLNYTTSNTTLIYVNKRGEVVSHNYGELDWSKRENFNIEFDLSSATLTDGCQGLISLTNGNWSSVLTVTLGDVYLSNDYAATLSGAYVADDSHLIDIADDGTCTSIDLTGATALPPSLPWMEGTNRIVYVGEGSELTGTNIVTGNICQQLSLTGQGGDFHPASAFTARQASFTITVDGMQMLMLPFAATLPEGVQAYTFGSDLSPQPISAIPAHTPVLVEAQGEVTFTASDAEVAYATCPPADVVRGSYLSSQLYAGDYVLGLRDGQWGFVRLTAAATLPPFCAYAAIDSQDDFIPIGLSSSGIDTPPATDGGRAVCYDLQGRRVAPAGKGITIVRYPDGRVCKVMNK